MTWKDSSPVLPTVIEPVQSPGMVSCLSSASGDQSLCEPWTKNSSPKSGKSSSSLSHSATPSSSREIFQRLPGSARGSKPVVSHSLTSSPFMVISAGGARASFFWKATWVSMLAAPRVVWMFLPHASACALVPPKPKEETPVKALSSRMVTVSESIWHGKPSMSKCGFLTRKWTFGEPSQWETCRTHLKKPQKPAPPSPCATLDLEDVMTKGSLRGVALMTFLKEPTSIGSPREVPVPWHSQQVDSGGVIRASRIARVIISSWAGPFGAVRLALRPSCAMLEALRMASRPSKSPPYFRNMPEVPSPRK
mmetsp:Transcript_114128/g.368726  ORF Transcript_114128/g.368726 Transcript_114128/m.368726 type:complete len:308 (+) Transcript_114128:379-1302(+)